VAHFEGDVDKDGRLDSLGLTLWLESKKGRHVYITVETEWKPKTLKQLARYWGVLLPLYMEYVGEEDKRIAHEDVLRLCSPNDKMLPNGEIVHSVKRTRDMSTVEHSAFTERFEMFLAKHGVL
jgi:hypothetical protein